MRKIAFVALLAAAPACFHVHYTVGEVAPASSPAAEQWHHDLIFGLAELSDPVTVDSICPAGFARIDSEQTFVNGLVQAITISIYNPQTVAVTCSTKNPPPSTSPERPYQK